MLLLPRGLWKLRQAISLCLYIGVAQLAAAQPNTLYIKPYLGFQQPFAKKIFSDVVNADFQNNRYWLIPTYGLRVELSRQRDAFFFEILNGQAGFNAGVNHKNYCRELNLGRVDSYNGKSANNYRLIFAYSYGLNKSKEKKRFYIRKFLGAGVSLDIRASEDLNAGKVYWGGTSSCGVPYLFYDTAINIHGAGVGIPVFFDLKSFYNEKPFISIHFFANFGINQRYTADLLYKTAADTRVSRVIPKGTVAGFVLSFPVKIWQPKTKKQEN
jgi:hypothetical protein